MSHLPVAAARVVETPAATMRTYASPTTTEGRAPVAVWRTEMARRRRRRAAAVDLDQVVVVVSGELTAEVAGAAFVVPGRRQRPAARRRRASAHRRPGRAGHRHGLAARGHGADRAGDPVPVPWAS